MTLAVSFTANSTIYAQTQSGMVFDAERGHDVPNYVETEIKAFLNVAKSGDGDRYQQTEAPFRWYLETRGQNACYADQPIFINIKGECRAVWGEVEGRLYLDPTPQEASISHYNFSHLTGYPLSGYFVPGGQ
jgi:hypothetical protein